MVFSWLWDVLWLNTRGLFLFKISFDCFNFKNILFVLAIWHHKATHTVLISLKLALELWIFDRFDSTLPKGNPKTVNTGETRVNAKLIILENVLKNLHHCPKSVM